SLAVERREGFAFLAQPGADRAFELIGVIDVQGTTAVIGNVVRDIHQSIDRPESDRLEPKLKPLRARPVLYAPNHSAGEHRAGTCSVLVEIELDRNGIGEVPLHRLRRVGLELAEACSGKVAGDAANAQAVWPVWRDGDLDHCVVEAESFRRRGADLGV